MNGEKTCMSSFVCRTGILCGLLTDVLVQPLITVAMLLFLYAGWHVRDEGGILTGLRVAFVDTRAYRADHVHEQEALMLQAELRNAAETDKRIDQLLTGLLARAPMAARVRLGVVHNGITGVTGVALLRVDVTNAVAAPGQSPGLMSVNLPLSDWNNFLPVMLIGKCCLGLASEQPGAAVRARLDAMGTSAFLGCPVLDRFGRMLGAVFILWNLRDLPPTGEPMQALMRETLAVGAQIAATLDMRGKLSPMAGAGEAN